MHYISVSHWQGQHGYSCGTQSGVVWFESELANSDGDGWEWSRSAVPAALLLSHDRGGVLTLGFGMVDTEFYSSVTIPYWFLILLNSVVLFFVWRKTRPAHNPKTAFPVDLTT